MGWFTAKDAPSDRPVKGKTISDAEWRSLQRRSKTKSSTEGSKRGAESYRKRHHN